MLDDVFCIVYRRGSRNLSESIVLISKFYLELLTFAFSFRGEKIWFKKTTCRCDVSKNFAQNTIIFLKTRTIANLNNNDRKLFPFCFWAKLFGELYDKIRNPIVFIKNKVFNKWTKIQSCKNPNYQIGVLKIRENKIAKNLLPKTWETFVQ